MFMAMEIEAEDEGLKKGLRPADGRGRDYHSTLGPDRMDHNYRLTVLRKGATSSTREDFIAVRLKHHTYTFWAGGRVAMPGPARLALLMMC